MKTLTVEKLYLQALKNPIYKYIAKDPDSIWTAFENLPTFDKYDERWKANSGAFGIIGILDSELDFLDISGNRIEKQNEYNILCGYSIPFEMIKSGQHWISSCGAKVCIHDTEHNLGRLSKIEYEWIERGELVRHSKDKFNFQCRYCLILNKENQ